MKMVVRLLNFELAGQNGRATAGVHNVTRADRMRRSVRSDRQLDAIVRELDAINRGLFVHFGARFCSMIQQHFIEITSCDLIRVIGLRTVAIFEVKFGSSVTARTDDLAAVFFYESGAQKFLV